MKKPWNSVKPLGIVSLSTVLCRAVLHWAVLCKTLLTRTSALRPDVYGTLVLFVKSRFVRTGIVRTSIVRTGIVASCIGLTAGCEQLADLAIDCIDRDGPEFNKSLLVAPVLNQVYSETITASIDNEPMDDRFEYEFAISGRLPAGITTDEIGRRLIFSGTAIETGEFPITVSVEVSHRNSNLTSGLCYTTESEQYLLTVLPM